MQQFLNGLLRTSHQRIQSERARRILPPSGRFPLFNSSLLPNSRQRGFYSTRYQHTKGALERAESCPCRQLSAPPPFLCERNYHFHRGAPATLRKQSLPPSRCTAYLLLLQIYTLGIPCCAAHHIVNQKISTRRVRSMTAQVEHSPTGRSTLKKCTSTRTQSACARAVFFPRFAL